MLSSDQPTKISAEEVIRNYTNANFIPQKSPKDRLHLLCQSRELNPLVSLSVENQEDESNMGSTMKTKMLTDNTRRKSEETHHSSRLGGTQKIPKYMNQTQLQTST